MEKIKGTSGYWFYMNTNTLGDFQLCISVPLSSLLTYNVYLVFYFDLWARKRCIVMANTIIVAQRRIYNTVKYFLVKLFCENS